MEVKLSQSADTVDACFVGRYSARGPSSPMPPKDASLPTISRSWRHTSSFSVLTDRRAGACPPYMPRKSGKIAMGWDCYGHFQSSCNAFFYDKQEYLMLELLANPRFSAFSSNPARGRARKMPAAAGETFVNNLLILG